MNYQSLLKQIQDNAIGSEGKPILPEEVEPVANALIERLILNLPDLRSQVQEELDQLRFNGQFEEPSGEQTRAEGNEEFSVTTPGDPAYFDPFAEGWSCA